MQHGILPAGYPCVSGHTLVFWCRNGRKLHLRYNSLLRLEVILHRGHFAALQVDRFVTEVNNRQLSGAGIPGCDFFGKCLWLSPCSGPGSTPVCTVFRHTIYSFSYNNGLIFRFLPLKSPLFFV